MPPNTKFMMNPQENNIALLIDIFPPPNVATQLKNLIPVREGTSDLLEAMKQISETGKGPKDQIPSAGCSIKWK